MRPFPILEIIPLKRLFSAGGPAHRGTRPNFAARLFERSGKPPLIRARLLLKRARLFILPANAATENHGPSLDAGPIVQLFNAKPARRQAFFRVGNEA
jgi:hypothetical protein